MDEDENVDLVSNEEDDLEESIIYRTYRMDFQNKRIICMIDGLEAAGQGMFKALQTRRYAYEIYDDQYGSDIMNKLGNIDLSPDYLEADMPVMISAGGFLSKPRSIIFSVRTSPVQVRIESILILHDQCAATECHAVHTKKLLYLCLCINNSLF